MAKTSGSIIGQGRSFTFVSHILSTISKRRLTVHVVIIPMLGYINQLQDNLIREKTKKQQKRRIRWWHSAAWFPVLMTFSFIWGPPCRSPSWDCAKKTSYRRQGAESQEERGHDHTDLTMTEMSDYGNRAKKGDGVEVSKATVSAAKQQQEKQKCKVKKNH